MFVLIGLFTPPPLGQPEILHICLQHVRCDTLVGGDHHVRRVEELDNRLVGLIEAGRWQNEEHHGLGRRKLLPLGHRARGASLEAGAKYCTVVTPSSSPTTGGGDEEDASAGCRCDSDGEA